VTPEEPTGYIALPHDAVQIKLIYYYRLTTKDTTKNDYISLAIFGKSGQLTSKTYYSVTNNTKGWAMGSVNLTPYKLKDIYFFFSACERCDCEYCYDI